ncbi:MAG: hypothetical protein Q9213_000457 [Squamulea squamosa]
MPTLKQLTCTVEWSASGPSIPLQEYGTTYFDGLVETWIAIPPISTPFSIRLLSQGYIAPGLSMFVYIDGEYQCNRGRNNLKIPTSTSQKHHTNVDFVVRQKEESLSDGNFLGRQWIFGSMIEGPGVVNLGSGSSNSKSAHMATIEVVVLRSIESQRPKAPNPSTSEFHPIVFHKLNAPKSLSSESAASSSPDEDPDISDFGGLFDGASDIKEHHIAFMPFGGDMAWDNDEQQNRGQHFSTDWSGGSQQQSTHNHRDTRSHAPSRSSSVPAATPAVQIFVNQPAANAPAPWSAAEPPQWRRPPGSIADSWVTPGHGSQSGYNPGMQGDNSWQPGVGSAQTQPSGPTRSGRVRPKSGKYQNSPQQSSSSSGSSKKPNNNGSGWNNSNRNDNDWNKSADQSANDRAQNLPATWNVATEGNQGQTGGHGWNSQGGASADWNAPHNNTHQDNGWNVDTTQNNGVQNNDSGWNKEWDNGNNNGNDQGNWDSNGQNSTPNDDWGDSNEESNRYNRNGDDDGWGSGQNDQTNQGGFNNNNNNGGQNEGGWNAAYGNGRGDSGWNNTGQGGSNNNQNTWDNTNAGAEGPQAFNNPSWDTPASIQNGGNQSGGANDTFPATTGGSDPAKTKSRIASSGKAKSVKSNHTQHVTMNSAVQNTGRKTTASTHGNPAPSALPGQQSGIPGAWPENSYDLTGFGSYRTGPTAGIKPYHVVPDAVGNPRLPNLTSAPPVVEGPAPTSGPVKSSNIPNHIQRGSPALYQHKTASPRYIDTHDKPYASFIFKYQPKAIIEQMLNLTIPDTDEMEKAKLAHLSKEELIEQVIKTKSQLGSNVSSAVSSLSTAAPSFGNSGNGGNGGWAANQYGGWKTNEGGNHGDGNNGQGPSGADFGTALNDKLVALAGQNQNSSSSRANKNNQGWNNAPPVLPLANDGNMQNKNNWNGPPPAGSKRGGGDEGPIDTWLNKTSVGASVSGHKPWNGAASVKSGHHSHGYGNWGGSQANNNRNGGWTGAAWNAGNSNGNGAAGWDNNGNENQQPTANNGW